MLSKYIPKIAKKYLLKDLIRLNISKSELKDFTREDELLCLVNDQGIKLSCFANGKLPSVKLPGIPTTHNEAILTYLTRYKFPHFAPGWVMKTGIIPRRKYPLFLHPQHKSTLYEIDALRRNEFMQALELCPGDKVLELGPYIGYGTTHMSNLVGENGRVLSVELDKKAFDVLSLNISQNNIGNVACCNCAVADINQDDGKIFKGGSQANSIVSNVIENGEESSIQYRTVESLLDEYSMTPNFIILTINGAEFRVLETCKDILKQLSPLRLIVPGWYNDGSGVVGKRIIKLLRSLDFEVAFTGGLHIFAYK